MMMQAVKVLEAVEEEMALIMADKDGGSAFKNKEVRPALGESRCLCAAHLTGVRALDKVWTFLSSLAFSSLRPSTTHHAFLSCLLLLPPPLLPFILYSQFLLLDYFVQVDIYTTIVVEPGPDERIQKRQRKRGGGRDAKNDKVEVGVILLQFMYSLFLMI